MGYSGTFVSRLAQERQEILLTVREQHIELEQSTFPQRLVFSWDTTFPFLEVKHALCIADRPSKKAERMISSPLFSMAQQFNSEFDTCPGRIILPLLTKAILAQ